MAGGPARHAPAARGVPPVDRQHEGLRFMRRREGAGNSGMTVGGSVAFILMAVAGACVGRRTGQARMPPVDRQHEGFRFMRRREGAGNSGMTVGGAVAFILMAVAGACVGRRTGQARMPPVDRQHEGFRFMRRREGAGNSGMTVGGAVAFILMAVAGACVGRRTGQARMPPVDRQHEGFRFLRRREEKNGQVL